jgi:hypothetical protein
VGRPGRSGATHDARAIRGTLICVPGTREFRNDTGYSEDDGDQRRGVRAAVFASDHAELHVVLGTVNTVLLLSSSLLVVLAVQRVPAGRRVGAWRLIAGALVLRGGLCRR